MKKKVLLSAPVLSKSGYGEHSRQLFEYLDSKEELDVTVNILPWGLTAWHLKLDECNGLIGKIVKKSNYNKNDYFDVSFQVQLPNEWNPSVAKFNVGLSAMVETDRCNPDWVSKHCKKMDCVVVPSEFNKELIIKCDQSMNSKVHVVPEHYFVELDEDDYQEIDLNVRTKFNFLTVGVLTGLKPELDRKNLFYLLKWFVEEFRGNKEVGLIIKTSQGRDTTIDRKSCYTLLKKILNELNHDGSPAIYLLHGDLNRKSMLSLYKDERIKCFVSLTRGEGFGLPMLEAAVAGLPVMATNWSAHTEFLNYGKWIKLDFDLKEINENKIDSNIFVKGARWAEVQESDFKKKLRKFYESSAIPKSNAVNLSNFLKKTHCKKSIMEKYDAIFKNYFQ